MCLAFERSEFLEGRTTFLVVFLAVASELQVLLASGPT